VSKDAERSSPFSSDGKKKPRGRPSTFDRAQVLGVARQVFLERGFQATTQEVAERAGVSEGSLFHHFKTKEGLFRAAMGLEFPELIQRLADALREAEGKPLEESLTGLGLGIIEVAKVSVPLMMMSWSNPECMLEKGMDDKRTLQKQLIYRFVEFFEAQIRSGQLRNVEPEVLTRSFLGSIHHYCMMRTMVPDSVQVMIPERMYVRGLVDLILRGALPRDAE
jgi:AcrR family transcriptional regulator